MDKTKLNLERLRAYDAEWEENKHPRADNGQFTSGSGSAGEQKSPLRKAAEAIKGGSGKSEGFNYSPEKKKNVLEILQRDINSFGPQSPVGEINSSLMNDLQKGKSFTVAVNNAKEKFKGKSDEHDAQLYNFYVMSKGPQGNENFSKEYKGNDFRSRKKVLEAEADSWLES